MLKEVCDMKSLQYMKDLAHRLVRGCTKITPSGVTLFTPDGVASYDALWLRDFAYMVEYAGDTITDSEIEGCVRFAIGGRRPEDGWMPDRIYADGLAVYAAGEVGKPVGLANLDNTPFLTFIIYELLNRVNASKARDLFEEWSPDLSRGLLAIPRSKDGLVYSNPEHPHSPYGFTDTVAKTGELMMESVLLWRACRMMAQMCARFGKSAQLWEEAAQSVEAALDVLYDAESGLFLAATQDCRQVDIWGSAYLLYVGFPTRHEEQVLAGLRRRVDDYVFEGQIRHLFKGEYWQRLLIDVPRETYQNGAYWATATGWIAWCLHRTDPAAAARVLRDVLHYFRQEGSFECVNTGYQKLGSFVVSATNVPGGLRRILAEDPGFEALMEEEA